MTFIICILTITGFWLFVSCKSNNSNPDAKYSRMQDQGFTQKNDTIWFYDMPLQDVDATSFEIVDDYFFKDKHKVYFYETYRESQDYFISKRKRVLPLENADIKTFVSLGEGYAKDKSTAWYLNKDFNVNDLESLTVLNHHFIKDIKTAYLDRKPVEGSDGKTFELISDHHAKDAFRYYYCTPNPGSYEINPIKCEYASFEIIDHQFAKDSNHVFYLGNQINKAHSPTFELISFGYSKDMNNVFYQDAVISGADPATFSTFTENQNSLGETMYAKDKNSIYINGSKFLSTDPATFRILNEKYTMDKNGVYFGNIKMVNAHPATFKVYPHFMGDADAEDIYHKYGEGKIVE